MNEEFVEGSRKWINERGNNVEMASAGPDCNRYVFDFNYCSPAKGFQQYDTDQDASYFGVWVNVEKRQVWTFCEGDLIRVWCPTEESFKSELAHANKFYGTKPAFITYDFDANGGATRTEHYEKRPS